MTTWYWEGTEKKNDPSFGSLIMESGSDELMAEVFMQDAGPRETKRVTDLIAAAPELLKSLEELVRRRISVNGGVSCSDGRYERAVAALRKAGVEI